jgi:hypothetical protein
MKRPALWLGLGAILVALGVMWQLRRGRPAPPPARATDVVASDEPVPAAGPLPRPHASEAPRLSLDSAPDDLGRHGTPAPEEIAQQLSLARSSVTRAARECSRVTGHLDRAQSLRVRMRLVVNGGEGHVNDPTILDGTLTDATARACVLGAFRSARWHTESRDRELLFEMELTLDELTR